MKSFIKSLFKITPLKLSFPITLLFLTVALIYDINPRWIALISTIAEKSLDYKFQIRGFQPTKSKIVIVAGDEKSFQAYGQWPFDRGSVFAPLLETLCSYNPKAVGLDIVWTDRERLMTGKVKSAVESLLGPKANSLDEILMENSGDMALRKAVSNCGSKIVLGYAVSRDQDQGLTGAEFEKRLKILTESGNNYLTSITKGKIKYSKDRGDADGNVSFYSVAMSGILNNPTITPPKIAQGFFNNEQDSDGNYRHSLLFFRADNYFVPSLTLRMAQKFLDPNEASPKIFIKPNNQDQSQSEELKLEINTSNGFRKIPIDLNGLAIVNYRGPNNSFPNVSMADVLSPAETIEYDLVESNGETKHYKVHKREFFKDALVLVGITALGLYDIRPRPLAPQASGVENHANILDNLINDDFLVRPTTEMLLWLMLAILSISLLYGYIISKLDAKWGALFASVSIIGLLYFDQIYLFNNHGVVFSGHLQAVQFLFQYLAITVLKYMREENEKKFIRSAFDKYVSPAVINSMLKDPGKLKLGGDKKELSILFSDIRGFTELSERVDVKTLTHFLNEYLGAMTDILQKNNGTLDKYIGDAVMGFWGAPIDSPHHATNAVKTAVEMMIKLDELNVEFQKKYGLKIDIGIGINSGPVSVGNFGSSKVFEYTVIGDNVNLASRLEGINKYYGTHIIISETTYNLINKADFLSREIDTVKVKGKQKPVKIYEIFPDTPSHQPLKNALPTFNEGLSHYYGKRWEQAIAFFKNVLKTRDGDRPTLELIERCEHYLGSPPGDDWDGSWEMHSK